MAPLFAGAIPADLLASAKAEGEAVVELVVKAFERGHARGHAEGRERAAEACVAERQALDAELVGLDAGAIVALEARFEAMRPSPITAAYYDGATHGARACAARVRGLGATDDDAH